MKNIAVIFGGKSVEHDISVITGIQMMKILSKNYLCTPIYIDGNGVWWTGKNLENVSIYRDFKKFAKWKRKVFVAFGEGYFKIGRKKFSPCSVIVCCHGINGEDGSVAGVLELAGIPYSSSGILSSAISMDKALSKIVLDFNKIKNVDFRTIKRNDLNDENLNEIANDLGFPLIIKPANLGSSVGISVCRDFESLKEGVETALSFDDKVLIEKFLEGSREFNCACFKFKDKLIISNIVEVEKDEIYSFEEKYIKEREGKNKTISPKLEEKIKDLTKEVYLALECFGVVRVDFLYLSGKLYVNEINSIPGAMACYLYPQHFEEVLDLVISESISRVDGRKNINYSFKSDALRLFEDSGGLSDFKK